MESIESLKNYVTGKFHFLVLQSFKSLKLWSLTNLDLLSLAIHDH